MKLRYLVIFTLLLCLSGCFGTFGGYQINLLPQNEIKNPNIIVSPDKPFEIPEGNVILKIDELKMKHGSIIKAKDGNRQIILDIKKLILNGKEFYIKSYETVPGRKSPNIELHIHKIEITNKYGAKFIVTSKGAKGVKGPTGASGHRGRDASCTGHGAGNGTNGGTGGSGGKGGNGGDLVIKYRRCKGFDLVASSLGGDGGDGGDGGPGGAGGAGKDCGFYKRGSGNNGAPGAAGPQGEKGHDGSVTTEEYNFAKYYFGI